MCGMKNFCGIVYTLILLGYKRFHLFIQSGRSVGSFVRSSNYKIDYNALATVVVLLLYPSRLVLLVELLIDSTTELLCKHLPHR
jgi:hypothetical protein